ncbi:MAG TPA: GerMN domain-containing protein [Clostridiales bacterium]|nr:GerMN domain-containing protein [Clostridiales bacterium]
MISRRIVLLIAIILTISILSTGCSAIKSLLGQKDDKETLQDELDLEDVLTEDQQDSGLRPTVLYYQDAEGYLVPVMRKIPWQEGIGKAAVTALIDEPAVREDAQAMGLYPTIPAGAEILGLTIKDGLAKIDFNEEAFECQNALEESNIINSVVNTLCEFPAVDEVQFLVEGRQLDRLEHGTDISSPLKAGNLNIETSDGSFENVDEASTVTVFFHGNPTGNFTYLVPITRVVDEPVASIETAISELIAGPKDGTGLASAIPKDTKLLGVHVDDGVVYLNFSKELMDVEEGQDIENTVLKPIVLTTKQFGNINRVKVLVEEKEWELADGSIIGDDIAVPTFINEY